MSVEQSEIAISPPITSTVSRVAIKLPPFWSEKPALWFAQIEAQFDLCSITADVTKFNYVVAQLDSRLAAEVEDVIINPPASNRYERIKSELIRRVSISQEQRIRQLLSEEELGDRKPSKFLRHLRSLAGNTLTDENILRQLWLQRLPVNIQAILSVQVDVTLDKVADLADKIIELQSTTGAHAPVHTITTSTDQLVDLTTRLDELTHQVAALSRESRNRPPTNRFRRRSLSRTISPSPKRSDHICWYHKTYQADACKCQHPCAWKKN